MKKKLFASLAIALLLGGCGAFKASTTQVPVTKAEAQQALAEVQKGHAITVKLQTVYLRQTPCGTPGARPAPLCASYRVGVQMKAYDDAFSKTISAAQNDIDTLGDNPTVLALAVKSAQLAYTTFKTFTETNTQGVQ